MKMRGLSLAIPGIIITLIVLSSCNNEKYNILRFGAIADGETNNSVFIQKAIDDASESGGGKVVIPAGLFVSGALFLKDNVELHLEKGAMLLGSTNRLDYGEDEAYAFISAGRRENISVSGMGVIDGRGYEVVKDLYRLLRAGRLSDEQWNVKRPREISRPELIAFSQCTNIKLTGITLKNSASWVLTFRNSDSIRVDSLNIISSVYWNNDGIDVVNCKEVHISNCNVNCADDAICLKSEGPIKGFCENILVENCTLRSSASGFKIGTGSHGGFRNVTVRNLEIYDTYRSAVAIESVDGGFLYNIDVHDIRAKHTGNAIFIRLGHRNKEGETGSLNNISIRNLHAEIPSGKPDIGYPLEGPRKKYLHNVFPASITGIPNHPVQEVVLENIEIIYEGGGIKETAFFDWQKMDEVAENEAGYPEFSMFGELPAWGFYVRHVSGLKMKNVKISLKEGDYRPAMIFNNVTGLTIDSLDVSGSEVLPNVIFKDVSGLQYENLMLPEGEKKGIFKWD
jgi:polygalacturonase